MSKVALYFVFIMSLNEVIQTCFNFKKSNMIDSIKYYMCKTPDNKTIKFSYLNSSILKEKIENEGFVKFATDQNFDATKKTAGILSDGTVLCEVALDGSVLLFPCENEYFKYLSGINYWDVSIFWSKEPEKIPYMSFAINRPFAIECHDSKKKHLSSYPDMEGYMAYMLADSSVCYLMHLYGNTYTGQWFPTIESFEYCYKLFAVKPEFPKM